MFVNNIDDFKPDVCEKKVYHVGPIDDIGLKLKINNVELVSQPQEGLRHHIPSPIYLVQTWSRDHLFVIKHNDHIFEFRN